MKKKLSWVRERGERREERKGEGRERERGTRQIRTQRESERE